MRLAAALAFVILTAVTGTADAHGHHKVWWKYLQGSWTYEATTGKGEVTFSMAPTGDALVGRWKGEDGRTAFEVAGWQADKEVEVVTGYGSQGNYWHIEFSKITADTQEGPHRGKTPDGGTYNGKIVVKKIDAYHWRWDFKGKNGKGEDHSMHGELTRKK